MIRVLNFLFSSIIIFFSWASLCYAENLTFTMLDVGQADSLLIQTAGKIVLVDAGEDKDLVKNKLLERNITNLDLVVATHPHADHVGGLLSVMENINIKVYIDNGFPHTTKQYENIMEAAEAKVANGMRYMSARQGQRLNLGKEAYFEILWPNDEGITGSRSDINANSVVMKLVHGDVCFLLTGDSEADTEQAVLPLLDKCQILKVAHHGTPHSSIPEFLDKVMPETALISVGLANKHGHPGKSTLDALAARNAAIYRTDWMGEITVVSNGTSYTVTTEKNLTKADLPCIDINRSPESDFSQLKGIGKTTTDRIFAARNAHVGEYSTVEEFLSDLPHETAHRLEKLKDYLATDCSYKTQGSQQYSPSHSRPGAININIADASMLNMLPGITLKRADDIIRYRKSNGDYKSCVNILKVKGIGPRTVEMLYEQCTTEMPGEPMFSTRPIGAPRLPLPNESGDSPWNKPVKAPKAPVANIMKSGGATASASTGAVNINTASAEQLASMPGMNAKKAEAAIEYRNANGAFKSCRDLKNVNGIGAKTVEKLLSVCTVE